MEALLEATTGPPLGAEQDHQPAAPHTMATQTAAPSALKKVPPAPLSAVVTSSTSFQMCAPPPFHFVAVEACSLSQMARRNEWLGHSEHCLKIPCSSEMDAQAVIAKACQEWR